MSADGKRIRSTGNSGPGQVCFSSLEVRKHFIRKLREYIKYDRKEAEQKNRHYPVFYDISVNAGKAVWSLISLIRLPEV